MSVSNCWGLTVPVIHALLVLSKLHIFCRLMSICLGILQSTSAVPHVLTTSVKLALWLSNGGETFIVCAVLVFCSDLEKNANVCASMISDFMIITSSCAETLCLT